MAEMRDYFEPIYFQSTFQGSEKQSGRSSSVKKSNSVIGGGSVSGNVLGRFLKIGKSKSDVQVHRKARSSTYNIDDLEEEFRLSPSVLNRGPVEKMVHKSNSRKDVSRSHSWIYGSVKLPSDLPFGYGYANGFGGYSPNGSDSNSGSGSPGHGHHTHGVAALQIPRCQMLDYYSGCDCTNRDFDFLTAGQKEEASNDPCQACAYDLAVSGGKNSKNRKQGSRNSTNSTSDAGKTFVNSVRKLTWKSLKQVVKKRPSLDNLKRPSDLRVGLGGYNNNPSPSFASPSGGLEMFTNSNGAQVLVGSHGNLLEGSNGFYDHNSNSFSPDEMQSSYFFPDKKNIFASCSEINRDPPPHVTASVRVRPKPSRQSWNFSNESGPVPNYQDDDLYHSEWDLRQCMPYDVWVNTTSNVRPRSTGPLNCQPKSPIPESSQYRNASLSKSTSVPYLSEIKSSNSKPSKANGLSCKSSSAGAVNNNDTISVKSMQSSKSSNAGSYRQPTSSGVVKRPSILATDVNAYQLLKAQNRNTKNSNGRVQSPNTGGQDLNDSLSSSSDDLSDNALTSDSHMRIAGQRIYMAPNLKVNPTSSSAFPNSSNGRTYSSASSRSSSTVSQNQSKNSQFRQEKPKSEDEWSEEELPKQKRPHLHVSMNRDRNQPLPNKENKGSVELSHEATGNVRNSQLKAQNQHLQRNSNGTHAGLNNGNYDNYHENNGTRSGFSGEETSALNQPSIKPTTTRINPQVIAKRDSSQNECVEFEEYVFHNSVTTTDRTLDLASSDLAFSKDDTKSTRPESKSAIRNPMTNPQRPTSYIKNGQNRAIQMAIPSPENKSNSITSTVGKTNNKFGALRRRKSRNGSNNPGKLLREVIYEEELEHDNLQESPKQDYNEPNNGSALPQPDSQRSNKSKEFAVKIVVSHSGGMDYVKPILKNRERVYDTPYTNGSPSNSTDNSYNEIYFDSSISTASTSKKKVQFDQSKVIVCGGDSGPDSDEYTNEEDRNEENDDNAKGNNNAFNNDSEEACGATFQDTKMNGRYHPIKINEESGSVSLKSNSSRKSGLADNDDNLSQNQSKEDSKHKIKSSFEEEVARKAASFALASARKKQAAEAQETANKADGEEKCYESVNNLGEVRLNEDQSRFASASTNPSANTTTFAKRKSNLKSNLKPSPSKNSQGTGSIIRNPDPSQQSHVDAISPSTSSSARGMHFLHNSSNNKPTHGVTSSMLKAQRITNTSSSERNSIKGSSQQQKIINPNSLLFNDTTRIRLNQTRPSLNETFKLNLTQNGQDSRNGSTPGSSRSIKQSNSFRTVGSLPLRPRDPPPPPPVTNKIKTASAQNPPLTLRTTSRTFKTASSMSTSSGQISGSSLSKSTSSNHGSNGALNGNRFQAKPEISLPMGLQTTYNQATSVIKSQNSHGQKGNGNCTSGFEKNGAKTPLGARTSLNNNIDNNKKMNANNGSTKSKSLTDRCEALDKVLGRKSKANATSTVTNRKEFDARNNHSNKNDEILTKQRPQQNMETMLNNTNGETHANRQEQDVFIDKSTNNIINSHSMSESQGIEIVTKENSVSEIRIYSTTTTTNTTPASANIGRISEDKVIYESTKMLINNEKNKSYNNSTNCSDGSTQEIHYAATDLFPQNEFLNGRKQFCQPAVLPPNPQGTEIAQSRPQSTSVVLIIDNNGNSSRKSISPSPLTYSQPVDTLSKTATAPLKPLPAPPLPPANLSPSNSKRSLSLPLNEFVDDDESEPLYDDVINDSHSTADPTSNKGSIGKKSLISSISSRKQSRKPLTNIEDNSTDRPANSPPAPPQGSSGHIVSSTLPCLACPPSLPPPNLPSKNLSEFHNRPVVLEEDEGERNTFTELGSDLNIDEEVDNLYNDISDGGSSHGKSLQSFASSMKGALLNAIKSIDFDRRSMLSNASNNSGGSGSTKRDMKLNDVTMDGDDFIYDDTLSIRSSHSVIDTSRSYYHSNPTSQSQVPSFAVDKEQSIIATKTLPPLSSSARNGLTGTKPLCNLMEQDETLSDDPDNEPLYDDVISMSQLRNNQTFTKSPNESNGSDSGAESEDAIPPPLPAQGPPVLPKISKELPLLTFPLLMNRTPTEEFKRNSISSISSDSRTEGLVIIDQSHDASGSHSSTLRKDESRGQNEDDVLTRTRSLLSELNEKLSQLNIISPEGSSSNSNNGLLPLDFSSYGSNKAPISSSSESSGVEEDYNSEKNYSLSNGSDAASASSSSAEENYKLTQVSKLVTETITMARGKFLDSMKSTNSHTSSTASILSHSKASPSASDSGGSSGSSPSTSEEPIYEEIGDLNRSTSPIYADAFDAKSIFDGASRNEILSFLESIRDRLTVADSNSSGSQSSSISSKKGNESERNDSGVGSESNSLVAVANAIESQTTLSDRGSLLPTASKLILRKLCPDCHDAPLGPEETSSNAANNASINDEIPPGTLCISCNRKRNERKEIITEIHETEMKYGRDLKIISEEFYKPIQIAGLLTKDQLDQIFLNVVELMEISSQLTIMLKTDLQAAAVERNDEDLTSVNVGKIFLDIGESMMTTFQTYCTRQANAGALLAQLEKEKELLRIFLRVSQMENTVLRRMNLPAFLMVPVQRVTRYPLLLSRLLKVTPADHFSRDDLQSAHEKIEQHLEHMNKSTREVASVKLWRRISIINGSSTPVPRRSSTDLDGAAVSIRKMAIDVLDWSTLPDVTCAIDNQLGVFHFNGKPLRGIYGCLLIRGKDLEGLQQKMDRDMFFPPTEDLVKEVKLVLVRVKNTRFCLLREPLCLSKCVISQGENEFQEMIEINEITTKNTYYLQGMDKLATANWLKLLQCYSMCVGQWRRRRGALANIMMNGMLRHL